MRLSAFVVIIPYGHTYATTLFKAGVDIKTAQRLLGHTNVKMTLDIYTHLETNNADVLSKIEAQIP
jgi:site-specific recombinase XerD